MSDAHYGKLNPGVGARPDDKYALPMCGNHHRAQHACGDEKEFWDTMGMDAIKVSLALYAVSGEYELGCEIVFNAGLADPVNIMAAG